jgi:hypothetical protein
MNPYQCETSELSGIRCFDLLRNNGKNNMLLQSRCHVDICLGQYAGGSREISIPLTLYFCLEKTGVNSLAGQQRWKASLSYVVIYQAEKTVIGLLTKPSIGGTMRIAF